MVADGRSNDYRVRLEPSRRCSQERHYFVCHGRIIHRLYTQDHLAPDLER